MRRPIKVTHIMIRLLLIYWPSWSIPYCGWFTHISGHPSATGQAWDRESLPGKDRRSTAVPRVVVQSDCFFWHFWRVVDFVVKML